MDEILQDERFVHVTHDPSFKRIPRRERKVKIDKRFQSMFHDNKFKVKYSVDKRGRPTNFTSQEDLKRFYELDSDSQSEDISETEESEDEIKTKIKGRTHHREETDEAAGGIDVIFSNESSDGNNNDKDEEDDENSEAEDFEGSELVDKVEGDKSISEKVKRRLRDLTVDYARGEGAILSDSSSDESSETEDLDEENDVDHRWGEMDQDAERTDQETERLAVCNMDWDRIHAQDLLVLLNSFLPKGGVIHSVTIYPSEYGMQRMKEEEEKGPIELTEETKTQELSENEEDEEGDGSHYHREKLRRYQLNRLRYYYAIVVCDSVQTASALYAECDGMEYESSAARLDLRFVPDGTEFEQEPREVCTELPDMKKYEPRLFITTALQQSKVQLTWDETDPRRLEFTKKIMSAKADDIDDSDLKVYLASSSSEEEEETEKGNESDSNGAAKYRALLQTIESAEKAKKDKDMEMEVTWGIGLKEKVDKRLKEGTPETKTPFEQYLVKRKEKLKAKRKEHIKKKQEVAESNENNEAAFSDDDIPSDVDFNDPFFKEELEDEKTVPSKGQKQKKREKKKEEDDPESKQRKAELELLLMDEDDDRQHFNLKDILENESNKNKKKKKKRKVEEIKQKDGFQVNVKDERFSALYTSHLFNIDPADPHYRKTKGMEALRTEKLSRRQEVEEVPQVPSKIPKRERQKYSELSLLVKNVKMKTQRLTK